MSEQTALLLARLSHQYSLEALAFPIFFGITSFVAGKALRRAQTGENVSKQRTAIVGRNVSRVCFAMSMCVFVVAFFHVGCATIHAHGVVCSRNVRELALAINMYKQDYDERYPPAADWSELLITKTAKTGPIFQKLDPETFLCPAAESPASYGLNAAIGGLQDGDVANPSNTVLLFDANATSRSFSGGAKDVAVNRHSGAPNVAFADGHVKHANSHTRVDLRWQPIELVTQGHPAPGR